MHPITSARTAAVLAALATGLGAFGAHGMKGHFDDSAMQSFETAVRYQMYHALALGLCARNAPCASPNPPRCYTGRPNRGSYRQGNRRVTNTHR
jgi:hypothetical protein